MFGFVFDEENNNGVLLLDHTPGPNDGKVEIEFGHKNEQAHYDGMLSMQDGGLLLSASNNNTFAINNDKQCDKELLKLYTIEHNLEGVNTVTVDIQHEDDNASTQFAAMVNHQPCHNGK